MFDIFNMFGMPGGRQKGGGGGSQVRKGKSVKMELKIKLEAAYNGELMKIPHQCTRNCEECGGKGGSDVKTCTGCKGRGVVEKMVQLGPGMYQQIRNHCGTCKGEGKIVEEKSKCKVCKGQKVKTVKKTLEVAVEKGVPSKHPIIMHGEADEEVNIIEK
jgi:DnaJ family protein A protein 2